MLVRRFAPIAMLLAMPWCVIAADSDAKKADDAAGAGLKYHDGTAEDKRSLGGSGEMLHFTLPEARKIAGIKIHGSRYGTPQPPKESFMIYVLDEEGKETLSTQTAPYSLFQRGEQKWVTVKFKKPIEVPKDFWLCLDFRAQATKGVYVSIDKSTEGKHSRKGLPGQEATDVDFGGDWMLELLPAK